MTIQNTEVESETAELNHAIQLGEALERLENNEDFKFLILESYLEEKALSSVSLLSIPQIKAENKRGDVMEDLVAISNLKYYFRMVKAFHNSAKEDLTALNSELEGN